MDINQIDRKQNGESKELMFDTSSNGARVYFTVPIQEGSEEENHD